MRRPAYLCLAVGVVVGVLVSEGLRGRSHAAGAVPEAPAQHNASAADAIELARAVSERRQRALAGLVAVLAPRRASGVSEVQFAEALDLLGDLHVSTPQAVDAVLRNLSYLRKRPDDSPYFFSLPSPFSRKPALGTVMKVGLPAVPALVEKIRTEEERRKREDCVWALAWMLGGRHAKSWLSEALEREWNDKARQRLREALQDGVLALPGGAYTTGTWLHQPLDKTSGAEQ